jgi:hypothetical protein
MSEGERIEAEGQDDDPRWNYIYIAVIVYTAATIFGLWLFTRAFE